MSADVKGSLRAIETLYNGYRFRSRTEARWAVFFKAAGIRYEYEKEGFHLPSGNYLPDFWLPECAGGAWFEVKGAVPTPREAALVQELSELTQRRALIAAGAPCNDDPFAGNIKLIVPWSFWENGSDGCALVDERRGLREIHIIGIDIGGWNFCDTLVPGAAARGYEAAKRARFEFCNYQ